MPTVDSTSVNFSISTPDTDAISIEISLDGDYHITLYGEAKSEFVKTEMVYLKVSPPYLENVYEILTSTGNCIKQSQGNLEDVVELLAFENTSSKTLSDSPAGAVTTSWVAGAGAAVLVTDKVITTASAVIGILKCEYQKKFDRLQLTVTPAMEDDQVIVMVGSEENGYDSITVKYTGESTVLRDVTLVIKDIISDAIIPEAAVTVTLEDIQIYAVTTNEEGKVTLQDMIIGKTYDLLITAIDYLDSDADYLNNDSFTVPEVE